MFRGRAARTGEPEQSISLLRVTSTRVWFYWQWLEMEERQARESVDGGCDAWKDDFPMGSGKMTVWWNLSRDGEVMVESLIVKSMLKPNPVCPPGTGQSVKEAWCQLSRVPGQAVKLEGRKESIFSFKMSSCVAGSTAISHKLCYA